MNKRLSLDRAAPRPHAPDCLRRQTGRHPDRASGHDPGDRDPEPPGSPDAARTGVRVSRAGAWGCLLVAALLQACAQPAVKAPAGAGADPAATPAPRPARSPVASAGAVLAVGQRYRTTAPLLALEREGLVTLLPPQRAGALGGTVVATLAPGTVLAVTGIEPGLTLEGGREAQPSGEIVSGASEGLVVSLGLVTGLVTPE